MNIQLRPVVLWLFIIFDLTVSSQVGAAPPASLDFALHLTRLDTPLKLGQKNIDATVKQIGITSFDISKFPLQPGIAAGYAYISDGDQAATAGMELQGFYLAPALRMVLREEDAFTAALTAC